MKDYMYKIVYTKIERKLYIIIQYSFINILLKKKEKYIYLGKFSNLSRIFNELFWFIYDLYIWYYIIIILNEVVLTQ